jgi:serine/threonine protein kinase
MKPFPGMLLSPQVRLVRELGRGGMGSVWVADHLTSRAPVAVKLFSGHVVGRREEALARFRREASAAARITSPHVVRIFDQGFTAEGSPYIVMELLQGETLAARLERVGRLEVGEVSAVVAQVGSALDAAHELGIIHRDIKPENVFLVSTGAGIFVKVLDFGIAKDSGSGPVLTAPGMIFGTPAYMSPEQLDSTKDVDARTDLWALSVLAYTALTGRPPFGGNTVLETSLAVLRGRFAPPSSWRPDLPPALDRWFGRALSLDRDARFETVQEMVAAFVAATVERRSQSEPRGATRLGA